MKKLCLLLLIVFSFNAKAQDSTYVPFDFENSEWSIGQRRCWSDGPGEYDCNNAYINIYAIGDTVLNGQSYVAATYGYFRQEGKKVYAYNVGDFYFGYNYEYLLYDFGLEVGDTFRIPFIASFFTTDTILDLVVVAKDSMQTPLGYRKIIGLNYASVSWGIDMYGAPSDYAITWIEGIGSNYGLVYNLFNSQSGLTNIRSYFLCYKYNGQYVYGSGTCDFLAGVDESKLSGLTIYPNPTNNAINIKLPENISNGTIQLFNSTGCVVKSIPLQNTIDVSALPTGMYYLRLQVGNGGAYSQKVIIQH